MASQKISALTAVTTVASGDYFPIVLTAGTVNRRVGISVLDERYTLSASGTAAQATANAAAASGNAALVDAGVALASGNAALTDLSGKYDKTGGPITGFVVTQSQTVGEISGPTLVSGEIQLNFASSNNWDLVLGGTTVLLNPANASGGQCGAVTVRQDDVGSRLLSYSGDWNFVAGTPPILTTTASGVDVLAYYCASSTEIQVVSNLNFS